MSKRSKKPSVREVLRTIKEQNIEFVDLKFVDLFGHLHHFTLAIESFDEDLFIKGMGFDGSSVRGFQAIHESDMVMKPDPSSMFIDPFMDDPTVSFFCNILLPGKREVYSRDTRAVAQRAERFLKTSGIADKAYYGPELEFYLFDSVRFDQNTHEGYYHLDNSASFWQSGSTEKNLGYKPGRKRAYFTSPPNDRYHNVRSTMVKVLRQVGVDGELHHAEVGSGGQNEIGIGFGTLTDMADNAIKYKYVIKNVARRLGITATFMPKPLFEEAGTGMHVNMSLWKDNSNLFYEAGEYGDLSQIGRYYIGGLLHHARSLCAFCNCTTNSYRRLVPGYEAPINLVYSASNRSACVRIPMTAQSAKAKRVEYRPPDPAANPNLAYSALLMAGLDGIINKIEPPAPIDADIYEMGAILEELKIGSIPGSLNEALDELKQDHEYLLRGGVFTPDLIEEWIQYKEKKEINNIRLRPHPGEFALYFDT